MICLVCPPEHFRIDRPINTFQRQALQDPPDAALALEQHAQLVAALERLEVEVLRVRPVEEAPYQVFVRDVVVGGLGRPIVGRLREPIRQPEIAAVQESLDEARLPSVVSDGGFLEGGDVVVSGEDVFVGLGDRTQRSALDWLREQLPERRVHALEMKPGFLHLDMVFNVFSADSCVYCPAGLSAAAVGEIRRRFSECLEVDLAAQRRMSTNFLPVGESALIAPASAVPAVLASAEAAGREVQAVDLSEIQKGGGSVRCSTCLA